MRDDSIRYIDKALKAGVEVKYEIEPKMFHCYPLCAPMFPEATNALKRICDFLKIRLDV